MVIKSIAVLALLGMTGIAYCAPEREALEAGTIIGDAVNIRSGPNINFEIINKLDKETPVAIAGQNQDWLKIKLPRGSNSYIHKQFITLARGMTATINGQRVNVRAGAHTKFNVIGQLNANDTVAIIGQEGEWYKIHPLSTSLYAWVSKEYVKKPGDLAVYTQAEENFKKSFFQLEQIEKYEEQERTKPQEQQNRPAIIGKYEELLMLYPQSPAAEIAARRLKVLRQEPQPRTIAPPVPKPRGQPAAGGVPNIISAEGKIMPTGRYLNRRWTHKLVEGKRVLYYLKSDSLNLNDYLYYHATVWGSEEELPRSAIRLLSVTQIKPISDR